MAITARGVYFYDSNYHLIKEGSLTYNSTTGKYTFVNEPVSINQNDINTAQIAIALPLGTFSGGMPMISILPPKNNPTPPLTMSTATWTIVEEGVETSYDVFYKTLDLVKYTYYAGRSSFMVGYWSGGSITHLDIWHYTVRDGINNYELIESDTYEEIYTALYTSFSDHAERLTAIESYLLGAFNYVSGQDDGVRQVTLYSVDGTAVLTFDGKDIIWNYRGINAEMFKNLVLEVEPASGVTFTNGMNVMYAGSIGASGKRLAKPTDLTELKANPNLYLGMITQVTDDGYGIVNWYGEVNNLNTAGTTAGQPVYVDNAGGFTTTKPVSPLPQIPIGLIERVNPTVGRISVRPNVGNYLGQLHDVYINGHVFTADDLLVYSTANARWEVKSKADYLQSTNDAIALKLSKDLSGLTDGGQIASNDLIYVYTNDGVPTKIAGSELTQLIKTITMNTSTYVLTITKYDGTQTTIDLPAEMAFVSASYSDVTQDLTFTLQNGSTVTVPLDDLVGGLASEDWVALYYYDKTETDAKYELLANKATDFSVVNDTKYTTVKAVDDRIKPIELDVAEQGALIADTQETLRKALNSDGVATADDDGSGIIAMGKDVAPAPVRVQVDGLLLDAPQLVTNGGFDSDTDWTKEAGITISGGLLVFNNTPNSNRVYPTLNILTLGNKYYLSFEIVQYTFGGVSIEAGVGNSASTVYGSVGFKSELQTCSGNLVLSIRSRNTGTTLKIDNVNVFNISTLITNKQYSPLYSTTFDLMSDAQIKAQMDLWVTDGTLPYALRGADMNVRLRATGINLFNKMLYATSYAYKIKVKPSTQYTWPASTAYKTYDRNMTELVSATGTTVTTGATAVYIAFTAIANVDTFQLEQGSTATTYAPYQDSDLYLQPNTIGYSYQGTRDTIEQRDGKFYFIKRINATLDGLLTTPVTTLIPSSGVLNAFSSGHIYIDSIIKDIALYGTSAAVSNSDYPITELKSIFNVTQNTELAVSGATIASGGLSFTHSGITAGDIVIFVYGYGQGLRGLTTVTYYDERNVVVDSVTAKVYRLTPAIASGVLSWTLTEI